MTDELTTTDVNDFFDQGGREPGCYAVKLRTPDADPVAVERTWFRHYTAEPPVGLVDRLASAERFCYVGSHGQSVYRRLTDHATGFQSSTIMDAWPVVGIVGVWPCENPRDKEWNRAQDLADENTACWQDGDYL